MKWHVDNLLVDPDPGPGVSQPTTLGELIRERRLAHGMSLSQFAANVGVETAVARTWERGEATPETERRSAVAAVLQLEPDVLDAAWPPADAEPMAEEVVEPSPEDNGSPPDPDTHLIAGGVVAAGAETSAPPMSDTSELPAAVLTEEPTQAVGAPFVLADPADTETVLVTVVEDEPPSRWRRFRTVLDPDKPWLSYLRTALTVGILLVLGVALVRLVPQLFDALGELLDTIQTEADLRSEIES